MAWSIWMQDKLTRYHKLSDFYKLHVFRKVYWELNNVGKSLIDGSWSNSCDVLWPMIWACVICNLCLHGKSPSLLHVVNNEPMVGGFFSETNEDNSLAGFRIIIFDCGKKNKTRQYTDKCWLYNTCTRIAYLRNSIKGGCPVVIYIIQHCRINT